MTPIEHAATPRWFAQDELDPASDLDPSNRLDENLDVLDEVGARRLNRRALWILASSVTVMLFLMVWVGRSFGSTRTPPAPAQNALRSVETPALPAADNAVDGRRASESGGGGSGGEGLSADPLNDPGLPPLPPAPVPVESAESDVALENTAPAAPATRADTESSAQVDRPSLLQRRIWNGNGQDPGTQSDQASAAEPPPVDAENIGGTAQGKVKRLQHPSTLLARGTYLRCVLASQIVSDVPGFTGCVLVEPVFAVDGRSILLERGTRLMGRYASGAGVGDRLEVHWDRALTPNGLDVALAGAGVDTLGGAGHPGRGSAHWGERISSALLISVVSDGFKYAAAKNGPRETAVYAGGTVVSDPFNSNTAQTAQDLATQSLAQGAARPRTVVIKQGTLLNVYVIDDIDFHDALGAPAVD